jgi:hypothetical protein
VICATGVASVRWRTTRDTFCAMPPSAHARPSPHPSCTPYCILPAAIPIHAVSVRVRLPFLVRCSFYPLLPAHLLSFPLTQSHLHPPIPLHHIIQQLHHPPFPPHPHPTRLLQLPLDMRAPRLAPRRAIPRVRIPPTLGILDARAAQANTHALGRFPLGAWGMRAGRVGAE